MERILVVEDDLALSTGLCFELDAAGYVTQAAYNCRKAEYLVEQERFSLALLDVNLPDGNGFELCRKIKGIHPELPVIFLTANDLEEDVLGGYDLGAEDYVTKPFRMPILLKKLEVALRRGAAAGGQGAAAGRQTEELCYRDDFLQLDFEALTALRDGEKLSITPNEYKLLRVLVANAGNVVTRRLLLEKLWDCEGKFIDDQTLTVTMNRLRAKIEDETHVYIKTVRGMGYIWEKDMRNY